METLIFWLLLPVLLVLLLRRLHHWRLKRAQHNLRRALGRVRLWQEHHPGHRLVDHEEPLTRLVGEVSKWVRQVGYLSGQPLEQTDEEVARLVERLIYGKTKEEKTP